MFTPAKILSILPSAGDSGGVLLDATVRLEVAITQEELQALQAVIAASFDNLEVVAALCPIDVVEAGAVIAQGGP
jgi:hypothetical protein